MPKFRFGFVSFVFLVATALPSRAQNYTCTTAPCLKASQNGWIVGEIKTFAFGATGKDQMTKELLAQGWVECAGQTVPRSAPFDQLFRTIGDAWGSADGKLVFYLPDLRGTILRDWNHGGSQAQTPALGGDVDAQKRTAPRPEIPPPGTTGNTKDNVGSAQPDAIQSHTHPMYDSYNKAQVGQAGNTLAGIFSNQPPSSTGDSNGRVSAETRPQNMYVMYAIYVGTPVTVSTGANNTQTLQPAK